MKSKVKKDKTKSLYLAEGFVSDGNFIASVQWLESLAGAGQLSQLLRDVDAAQIRDGTAKILNHTYPIAPKSLGQLLSDVKLKYYRPVDLTKAKPVIEFNRPKEKLRGYGHMPRDFSESVQAMALPVPGSPVRPEININYFGFLTVDPDATVMAKRHDRPIAIVKNGQTVAVIMPMTSISTAKWEAKNEKNK